MSHSLCNVLRSAKYQDSVVNFRDCNAKVKHVFVIISVKTNVIYSSLEAKEFATHVHTHVHMRIFMLEAIKNLSLYHCPVMNSRSGLRRNEVVALRR